MKATFQPSVLRGEVTLPPSKSAAHRAILCAALSQGKSVISPVSFSKDMEATIHAVQSLGARVEREGDVLTVDGTDMFHVDSARVDCFESGSTLRFLIPIAAAGGVDTVFTGSGRLPERPIGLYTELLPRFGVRCETQGGLPFHCSGRLCAGQFDVPGNVSSQYVTGLLMALPLLEQDSFLHLTKPLESAGYVDMTIEVMREFGVKVFQTPDGYLIRGRQRYQPSSYQVEGDWSQAAFFLSAALLGGEITLNGLNAGSIQGDRECLRLFEGFGLQAAWNGESLICKGRPESSQSIDAAQIPDLVPALAVSAAFCPGTTRITGAARLRLKESDRIQSVFDGLRAIGARVEELPDGLVIHGGMPLHGGFIHGCNDHRIVMAFAMAALSVTGETVIDDVQSIRKSYPEFLEEYHRLGGKTDVVCLG